MTDYGYSERAARMPLMADLDGNPVDPADAEICLGCQLPENHCCCGTL